MKKEYKITLIGIIIINILLSLLLLYYNKSNNIIGGKVTYNNNKTYELNNMIIPENRFEFEKIYDNMNNCDKIYKNMYKLIKYMPKLYKEIKDLDDKQLLKYYEDDKSIINNLYTINTEDQFISIVKQCKQVYKDGDINYKTVRFLLDSYEKQGNLLKCNFEIEYYNSVIIKYNINIYNTKDEKVEMFFIPVIE